MWTYQQPALTQRELRDSGPSRGKVYQQLLNGRQPRQVCAKPGGGDGEATAGGH